MPIMLRWTRQALAIVLSASLGTAAYAAPIQGVRAGTPRTSAPGSAGAAYGVTGVASIPFRAPALTLSAPGAAPQAAPPLGAVLAGPDAVQAINAREIAQAQGDLAAAQALPAAPLSAVSRHPVFDVLNDLQRAGVRVDDLPRTAEEARALKAAIRQNIPAGGVRDRLVSLADGLEANLSGGSLGAAFDGASLPRPGMSRPPAKGFWAALDRLPVPKLGLGRLIRRKAEASRPALKAVSPEDFRLPVEKLRWVPAPESLPASTREVEPGAAHEVVGQDRGLKSLRFGLEMEGPRYNVIVAGPDASGRETAVRLLLGRIAGARPTPLDRVAVTNFEDPEDPVILRLAPGNGPRLEKAVAQSLQALKRILPQLLLSGDLGKKKKELHDAWQKSQQERFEEFNARHVAPLAQGRYALRIVPTHDGAMVAVAIDGKLLSDEQVGELIAREKHDAAVTDKVTLEGLQAYKESTHEAMQALVDGEEFQALIGAVNQAHQKVHALMDRLDQQAVGQIVGQFASILAPLAEDEAHAAFRAKVEERQARLDEEIGKIRLHGRFGLKISQDEGSLQILLTYLPAQLEELGPLAAMAGMEPVPVTGEEALAALKAQDESIPAGLTFERLSAEAMEAAGGFLDAFNEMNRENQADYQALPEPTAESRKALGYIKALLSHWAQNHEEFLPSETPDNPLAAMLAAQSSQDPAKSYRVNVLSTNDPGGGAPVRFARSPTVKKIFGYAENGKQLMMVPGAGMVRRDDPAGPELVAGEYIEADGGYLVMDLMDVLREPGLYQTLMRMLRTGKAEIGEDGIMSLMLGRGEHYEVPDVNVKVVFIGSPLLRMLLSHYDEDFAVLFKAVAEFESSFDIAKDKVEGYLRFMRNIVEASGGALLHLAAGGIQAVLEQAARIADSNERLTARFGMIYDLMREASHFARQAGHEDVQREDVELAVREKSERSGSMRRRMHELYIEDTFRIFIDGAEVGQMNGMAVVGDSGVPARITFEPRAKGGSEFVVSAEQMAGNTGQSFDKSIANVKGFIGRTFGRKVPVPVEISISFEQNYGGIDGDSATQTMIYGILSALSGVPFRQGFAITGSMDQKGNIQPIGGAKEKIEGYFDVVQGKIRRDIAAERAKDSGRSLREEYEALLKEGNEAVLARMNGQYGVIIPLSNVGELQLRPDIVAAATPDKDNKVKFHVLPVDHISQGVELLSGRPYLEVLERANAHINAVRTKNRLKTDELYVGPAQETPQD